MATRQLNKYMVLALSAFASLAMVVLAVLMLAQLRSADPAKLLELAQQAADAKQWEQAGLFYLKAYQRTRDSRHLVRRGDMALNEGDLNMAIASWREASVNDPTLMDAHLKQLDLHLELARLYGGVQTWLRVKETAEKLFASEGDKTPQELAHGHHATGLALLKLSSQDPSYPEQGLLKLELAVELAPDDVDYAIDLAVRYLSGEREATGTQILTDLMQQHTQPGATASRLRTTYAKYLSMHQRLDEADAEYQQAIALAQGDRKGLTKANVAYGVFLSQRWATEVRDGKTGPPVDALYRRAETTLRDTMESDPQAFEPPFQLAVLYKADRSFEEVIEVCEHRLSGDFMRRGVEAARNRRYVFLLSIKASEACTALAALAELPAPREEWLRRAEQYLADARGEERNHPLALAQEGRIRLAEGRDRAALEALRAADKAYESYNRLDWDNKITLAKLHLKLREPGAARDVLDSVMERARSDRGRDLDYWITYAHAMYDLKDYDACLTVANRILAFIPGNEQATRLKAAALDRMGLPRQARAWAQSGPTRAILEAKQLAIEGDDEQAIQVLRDALEQDPAHPLLLRTLIGELVMRDRLEEAAIVVQQGLQADPDSPQIKAFSVWVKPDLLPEERDRRLLDIIADEKDAYRRMLDMIVFHLRRQEFNETLAAINEALRLLDDRATPFAQRATVSHVRALVAEKLRVATRLGNEVAQIEARDYALAKDVDGAGGQTIVGLFHMYREQWDLAITAFKDAVSTQSTDTRTLTHLGQCLLMTGELDDASVYLQRAISINPNEPLAHRGLGRLAQMRGDTAAYEHHLSICEDVLPNDPWVQAGVEARRDEEDPASAIKRREALLLENPDDENNLRRLALLCERLGDRSCGDRYHERLLKLKPDDHNLVFAVSAYFRRTQRKDRALEIALDFVATRTTPEERTNAQVLVSRHLIDDGRVAEAESTLLTAADEIVTLELAQSLGTFYLLHGNQAGDALRWFDRAVDIAISKKDAKLSAVMASRVQCLLDRRINKLPEARKAIDEMRARFPDNVEGLLLDAELYSRTGEVDRAIGALGRYVEEVPNDVHALQTRARFLIAQGQTAAAIEDLVTIKRVAPLALDLAPRLSLAHLHRQAGKTGEWIAELESMVEDSGGAPNAVEALVAAYTKVNRLGDADRLVTARINQSAQSSQSSAAAGARWWTLRGRISDQLGDHTRALVDYQKSAQLQKYAPAAVADVLDVAFRSNKLDLGIRYFDEHTDQVGGNALCRSWYAVLLATSGRTQDAVDSFRRAMATAIDGTITDRATVTRRILTAFPGDSGLVAFGKYPAEASWARADRRIRVRLLRLARRMDEAVKAVDDLIRTCAADAERAQLLEERGDLHALVSNPAAARQSYEEALKYNDRNWVLLNNLAFMLADDMGNPQVARPYAERAVAIQETSHTLDTLGWIYVQLADYTKGIGALNRALRLNPDSAESAYHLGEAHRRNRQYNQATDVLRRALELAIRSSDDTMVAQIERSMERVQSRDATPSTDSTP